MNPLQINRPLLSLIASFALAAGFALPASAQQTSETETPTQEIPTEKPFRSLPEHSLTPEILYTLILGEIAGARGRFDIAVDAYLHLAQETRDPRIARRATEIALFAHNIPAAAEMARLWSDSDPHSEDARQVLAGVLASGGAQINEIQFQLARVLAENPERLEQNLLTLNRALGAIDDKDVVREIVERLTIPYDNLPAAQYARAQSAIATDDYDASLNAISKAIELRPEWEPATLFKAQLLVQMEEIEQAQQLLRLHLHQYPDSHAVRQAYARILVLQQHPQEALLEFRYLLDAMPNNPDLIYAVGTLSAQLGDTETASRLFERLLDSKHRDADGVRLQLGQIAEKQGDSERALQWYRAITQGENYLNAQARIATILAQQGKLDEARRLLRSIGGDDDERRQLFFIEIMVLRDSGHDREAMDMLDDALSETPNDTGLLYESAMVAERLKRINVMETRLRRVIELEPENAHAYNALGYTLADNSQRLEEAEQLIATALELQPDDPYILDSMGWVRFRRGDAQTAAMFLQHAYDLRPEPEIAAHLGEVLWALGRREEARQLWRNAQQSFPDSDILKETIQRLNTQ